MNRKYALSDEDYKKLYKRYFDGNININFNPKMVFMNECGRNFEDKKSMLFFNIGIMNNISVYRKYRNEFLNDDLIYTYCTNKMFELNYIDTIKIIIEDIIKYELNIKENYIYTFERLILRLSNINTSNDVFNYFNVKYLPLLKHIDLKYIYCFYKNDMDDKYIKEIKKLEIEDIRFKYFTKQLVGISINMNNSSNLVKILYNLNVIFQPNTIRLIIVDCLYFKRYNIIQILIEYYIENISNEFNFNMYPIEIAMNPLLIIDIFLCADSNFINWFVNFFQSWTTVISSDNYIENFEKFLNNKDLKLYQFYYIIDIINKKCSQLPFETWKIIIDKNRMEIAKKVLDYISSEEIKKNMDMKYTNILIYSIKNGNYMIKDLFKDKNVYPIIDFSINIPKYFFKILLHINKSKDIDFILDLCTNKHIAFETEEFWMNEKEILFKYLKHCLNNDSIKLNIDNYKLKLLIIDYMISKKLYIESEKKRKLGEVIEKIKSEKYKDKTHFILAIKRILNDKHPFQIEINSL